MLQGCIKNSNNNMYDDPQINRAIDFLAKNKLVTYPTGRYSVEEDIIYVNIDEYNTIMWNKGKFEAHKKYIDIQYMISGEECITIANISDLRIKEEYSEKNDITFYEDNVRGKDIIISEGEFIILYPEDAHRPMIAVNTPKKVKKAVVKILVD